MLGLKLIGRGVWAAHKVWLSQLNSPLLEVANDPPKQFCKPSKPPCQSQGLTLLKAVQCHAFRMMAPTLVALTFASAAQAQGTMDFSGAQTLMGTFKTFAVYAGAVSV